MNASREKAKISLESHVRVYTHFGGQCSEANFRGALKEVCKEVWWKFTGRLVEVLKFQLAKNKLLQN